MDNSSKKTKAKQSQKTKTSNKGGRKNAQEIDDKLLDLLKTVPKPTLLLYCCKCNISSENTKLYIASCVYNHSFCFKCLYQNFFLNISDCLNHPNNKNQIIIPCNLCINTTTKGNIFIDSKDFLNSLKSLSFPTNFTKSLTPCKIHNNKVSIYCENCEDYICEFCSKNEHGRHSFKLITEKIEEIKEKIKKLPLKVTNYETKTNEINEKNNKNYNDIYSKTIAEIEKLISALNELKTIFINQMHLNHEYYKTFTDIINTSFSTYYTQIKNIQYPFNDYGIPYLNFINSINEEMKTFTFSINPSIFQEVESSRKKIENLLSNTKINSTCSLSITCTKVHEYKCINTIKEHSNYINCMLINRESKKLITCSDDKLIKVFDIANHYKPQTLKGHGDVITTLLQLTPTKFASGSEDKLIKIWECKTSEYKCVSSLKGHTAGVTHIVSINNEDGTPSMRLISASNDNTIRIWEPKGDYKHSTSIQAHNGKITSLIYIREIENIITSSLDNTIKVFDMKLSNKIIFTLKEHTGEINGLVLLNPNILLSFSNDCYINAYNTREEYKIITKIKEHTMAVTHLKKISNDLFASISKDKTIKIFDGDNEFKCLCTINVHKWEIYDLCFCYDTKMLYSASQDKTIKAVKILNWGEYNVDKSKYLIWKCESTLKSHERDVTIVDLIDNETVISTGKDFMIKLWKEN